MFSKLALIVTSACALAAVAAPTSDGGTSSCNNSNQSLQCCNSTQNASNISSALSGLLAFLGFNTGSLTGLIGFDCGPISVVGGPSCTQQPVCCDNNNFNGLIVVGCSPVNIGL